LVAAQIKTILFVDKENNIEDFNVNWKCLFFQLTDHLHEKTFF
jgi:hypothetical protein